MKMTVFGAGYVGLVTAACCAEVGNTVMCVDIDAKKIDALQQGKVPIYEQGLSALVQRTLKTGCLRFTSSPEVAVSYSDTVFIAVGTPEDNTGDVDLRAVYQVVNSIADHMQQDSLVVIKSTVPVGTTETVARRLQARLQARGSTLQADVAFNPEFLKEGVAISDFMKPDRIIIGAQTTAAANTLQRLHAPFTRSSGRFFVMDPRSAELTKYAANAMLATKISFMNELSGLAERLNVDIESVRQGIGADQRIGYAFIYPGCGYGGSCFPKDVSALRHMAQKVDYPLPLVSAVQTVNQRQKRVLFDKINSYFSGQLADKSIAIWGLAFKPGTDDVRAAPSLCLVQALLAAGATVQAYDPLAGMTFASALGAPVRLLLAETAESALEQADALVVVTEWKAFHSPDFDVIKQQLRHAVLFDGRNIYDPAEVRAHGIAYHGIGRLSQEAPTLALEERVYD